MLIIAYKEKNFNQSHENVRKSFLVLNKRFTDAPKETTQAHIKAVHTNTFSLNIPTMFLFDYFQILTYTC